MSEASDGELAPAETPGDLAPLPVEIDRSTARYAAVGRRMRDWEVLRFVYNAVMVGWSLVVTLVVAPSMLLAPAWWEAAILGGIFANFCFCTGHVVDGYITWLTGGHRALTAALFALGTGFSLLLVLLLV